MATATAQDSTGNENVDQAIAGATLVGAPAKLAFIQGHIAAVDKTGVNTHHNYAYFQEHGLLEVLGPFFRGLRCGVRISPTEYGAERDGNRAIVNGCIEFFDAEQHPLIVAGEGSDVAPFLDGHGEVVPNPLYSVRADFTNEGVDNQDKATNKALTGWTKYALQKLFCIPTESVDDADRDYSAPIGGGGKGAQAAPAEKASESASQAASQEPDPDADRKAEADANGGDEPQAGPNAGKPGVGVAGPPSLDARVIGSWVQHHVEAGHLDGNKFKAKVMAVTKKSDRVSAASEDERKTIVLWAIEQVKKSKGITS